MVLTPTGLLTVPFLENVNKFQLGRAATQEDNPNCGLNDVG